MRNLLDKFFELHFHEKLWVLLNPLSAAHAIRISHQARQLAFDAIADAELDGDENGGQVDAFRHILWMAMLCQKIGERKALSLGKAHEQGNYADYKQNILEEGMLPTYTHTQMDLYNNKIGVNLGKMYPTMQLEDLIKTVKNEILNGKALIINKNKAGKFLSRAGEVISVTKYYHKWYTPINLVYSNQQRL